MGRHPPSSTRTDSLCPCTTLCRSWGWALGAAATAMAAVAVVLPPLGLWPSWSEMGADYRTSTGEQRDVQVGAHIRVALNTQTSISVQGQDDQRQIQLIAGEAAIVSDGVQALEVRSEERRVGNEGGSPCRSRWWRYH